MLATFNTPILLITFNRPTHTRLVWNEIKKQQPKQVFIFQDGAREGNTIDTKKREAVRTIFEEERDWDCELKTFYSNENAGCGKGPAAAISWFFENVDQGIIIEDDTVPGQDFFGFAEELLLKYQNHTDIRAITSMKVDDKIFGDSSYYFSMMNRTFCAWATWKRAWSDFDYYLRNISQNKLNKTLKDYGLKLREREYWLERLVEIQKDGLGDTSWDQQFWMSIWLNNGKGICPNKNLSKNIGFDNEGTHTLDENNIAANIEVESILPLKHPKSFKVNRIADLRFHKIYFESYSYGIKGLKRLPFRLNKRLKRLLDHEGSWIK